MKPYSRSSARSSVCRNCWTQILAKHARQHVLLPGQLRVSGECVSDRSVTCGRTADPTVPIISTNPSQSILMSFSRTTYGPIDPRPAYHFPRARLRLSSHATLPFGACFKRPVRNFEFSPRTRRSKGTASTKRESGQNRPRVYFSLATGGLTKEEKHIPR
jgi:hypothetical protein